MDDLQTTQPRTVRVEESCSIDSLLSGGQFCKKILVALKEQRDNERYCDLTIKTSCKTFRAHKNVLAALSPYFEERISEEPGKSVLEISWISPDNFAIILDFAYGVGFCDRITDENVQSLFQAGCRLLITPITRGCAEVLGDTMDATNMIQLYDLATEVSCSDLTEFVNQYVRKNFKTVSEHSEFLELKLEDLIGIIKSDDFCISEEIIFDSVLRWIKHKEERKCLLHKLMSYIRLATLSSDFLRKRVQEDDLIRNSPTCVGWISEILLFKLGQRITEPHRNFMRPRLEPSSTQAILVMGETEKEERTMLAYSLEFEMVTTLTITPLLRNETLITSATNGENAFVAGSGRMPVLVQYNSSSNEWISIDDKYELSTTGIAWLNGFLYSTVTHASGQGPEMKRFDPDLKEWTSVANMPYPRWDCSIVVYQDMIYVIGGTAIDLSTNSLKYTRTLQRYKPESNTWVLLREGLFPVTSPESEVQNLLCCAFQGKLLVIDGTPNNRNGVLTSPHVYNIAQNSWSVGPALHQAYMNPTALMVLNGAITFIDTSRFPYLQLEIYSSSKSTWTIHKNQVKFANLTKKNVHIVREALKITLASIMCRDS